MSADDETYDDEEEEQLINAEQVTVLAKSFLKRMGNNQGLKPIKASLEEDIYVVEIGLPKKIATVQIDAATEHIKEYEIKDKEQQQPAQSGFPLPLTPKNIIILAGTAVGSVVISALLGLQSLIPSII